MVLIFQQAAFLIRQRALIPGSQTLSGGALCVPDSLLNGSLIQVSMESIW